MEGVEKATSDSFYGRLQYRCQFVLGPSFVEKPGYWKRVKVGSSIFLTVHPDLNVYQVIAGGKSMILLGFLVDPDSPEIDDAIIVDDLIHKFSSFDHLFEQTYRLGGRWVLIADDGQEVRLFNDATGLRQVFYTDVQQVEHLWCASQPGIIAGMVGLSIDEQSVDFINWFRTKNKEYWWPGDSSLYKEIKHLLPNHYLNLATGWCHRYWPNTGLDPLPLDEAIERISRTLTGLMRSASHRFDLALGLSSGWDSRLVLAACKEIGHRISFYSVKRPDMSRDHPDIVIPSRLLSKLHLEHDIIDQDVKLRGEFAEVFESNVPFAHGIRAPAMQANLDYYHQSRVAVTGNVSGVARCCYRLSEPEERVTASALASLTEMGDHPFVIKSFEQWLLGLSKVYNFDVLDLFYWEQRMGNWFAMNCLEFDIAWQDIFIPYNTRSLLVDLLSVDEQHRQSPKVELYQKLILSLWPEVLSEPTKLLMRDKGRGMIRQLRTCIGHQLQTIRSLFGSRS